MMTADDIFQKLNALAGENYNHVTISGGNPALLKHLADFVEKAKAQHIKLAVETQGTMYQEWLKKIDDVTISPKPPSSGMHTDFDKLEHILNCLNDGEGHYNFKVVVFDDADFEYAVDIHHRYPEVPFYLQIGNPYLDGEYVENHTEKLMTRYAWLVDKTMADARMNDVRILPQLHTLLWSNKQGV